MARVSQSCKPRVLLDVGCGKGELLVIAAKSLPDSECIGIDIGKSLREAKRKAKVENIQNVQFVKADCTLLPFRSGSLQLVFCASVLEHLVDVPSALLEIERILELDGRLVIGVPTENRVYQISRAMVGLRKPTDHFHQGAYIEALAASRFADHQSEMLPFSFLPRFLSLYIVLVCNRFGPKTMCVDTSNQHH
jgi:ubiquinone/menaquinone biosynthesis C-methylase UbiE